MALSSQCFFGSRQKSHVGGFGWNQVKITIFPCSFFLTTGLKLPGFAENFQAISSKCVTTANVAKVVISVCISRGDDNSTASFQFV